MKKLLVLTVLFGVLLMTSGVLADTSNIKTYLSTTGTTENAISELSTQNTQSNPNSAHFWAAKITGPTNEGRVRIQFNDVITLNDIQTISWQQYVEKGYLAHVDIKIDTDGNGAEDDALVFEYAKVDQNNCDAAVQPYPTGQMNTLGGKIIDDTAYGWLSSGPPGPCGDANFDSKHFSLANWKLGQAGVPADVRVIALEIEVDGWIAESESFIDDVTINGVIVQNFDDTTTVQVDIDPTSAATISPSTLNFGHLVPGKLNNPGPPITIDPTGSNIDVRVEVTDVVGFPFETGLKFNGALAKGQVFDILCIPVDNICSYTPKTISTTLDIPSGTIPRSYLGTITYTISGIPPAL